jgi:magnesium-transporting ATPase (P-type)
MYEMKNPMQSQRAGRQGDSMILYSSSETEISRNTLESLNVEQSRQSNKENLEALGGIDAFVRKLGVDVSQGLSPQQVVEMRRKFGDNVFPESPMNTFFELFLESFEDVIIIILMCASAVSLGIGVWEDPRTGWIEGTAILIAVLLVALVTAGNNYSKELQFRSLEKSSQQDERCSVLRNRTIERLNPIELVVGDVLILQVGEINMSSRVSDTLFSLSPVMPFQRIQSSSTRVWLAATRAR